MMTHLIEQYLNQKKERAEQSEWERTEKSKNEKTKD